MKTWWLAAFIIIGVLLTAGVLLLVTRPPRGQPIILLPAPTPAPITIFVSGGVRQAGLYALPYGSRVNDAIQSAGGFSEDADTGAINLAATLQDGEQVDVPTKVTSVGGGLIANQNSASKHVVDINAATLEELDTLPGIGPITAQKIIDYRAANGPFLSTDGLLAVDGIGQATFEKIKGLITVGTSP